MSLEELIKQKLGHKLDFDGIYDAQCVDLIKFYAKNVLSIPVPTGDAWTYDRNPQPLYLKRHRNDLWYIPPRGSIAVWNRNAGGGFGHVSIVLSANLMSFTSLDQNWPQGAPVTEVKHNYRNVVSFLIPRKADIVNLYNALIDDIDYLRSKYKKVTD